MKIATTLILLLLSVLTANFARADEQELQWNEVAPHFFVARNQLWRSSIETIQFDVMKMHLGFFDLKLVDVAEYAQKNRNLLDNVNDNRKFSTALLDVGVENLLRSYPDGSVVATVAAGWSATLKKVEQVGLLRIAGVDHADVSDNPSMSAVICLNSPAYEGRGYDYQIPTFYRLDIDWQLHFIDKCHDALQIGPRIIEDAAQGKTINGIEEGEIKLRPQIRTIMIVDAPIRNTLRNFKGHENARNAYFLITTNAVHLLSIQEMLLSNKIYGTDNHPEWAINLVNGGPSGMSFRDKDQNAIVTFGNPSGVFGSAIVISRRR